MTVREINLKYDMPPAAVALRRMENELAGARRSGQKLFKFVHGYGSTGAGDKIRGAVRRALAGRPDIAWVLPGEEFGPFSAAAREAAGRWPSLRQDRDWGRENDGVTVVVLR